MKRRVIEVLHAKAPSGRAVKKVKGLYMTREASGQESELTRTAILSPSQIKCGWIETPTGMVSKSSAARAALKVARQKVPPPSTNETKDLSAQAAILMEDNAEPRPPVSEADVDAGTVNMTETEVTEPTSAERSLTATAANELIPPVAASSTIGSP